MLRNISAEHRSVGVQGVQRGLFVGAHQARITDHIGAQDGCNFAPCFGHAVSTPGNCSIYACHTRDQAILVGRIACRRDPTSCTGALQTSHNLLICGRYRLIQALMGFLYRGLIGDKQRSDLVVLTTSTKSFLLGSATELGW